MEAKFIKAPDGESLLGGRQIIKLRGEDTAGTITVMTSQIAAGAGVPLHVHLLEDEIFQIIDGEVEVRVGEDTKLLKQGDMIFLPRTIPHGFKAVKNTLMWTTLTPAGIEKMFVELAELPPGPPDMEKMVAICQTYKVSFPGK